MDALRFWRKKFTGNKKGEFLKGLIIERKLKEERCNDCRENANPWKSSKVTEGAGKIRLGPTQEGTPKEGKAHRVAL